MTCTNPRAGYRRKGATSFSFKPRTHIPSTYETVLVDCGVCISCRLDYSRQWSIRAYHELLTTREKGQNSWFVTFTYRPEDYPTGGSLVKRDFQLFMKRLRKSKGEGIRYLMCGEYGEKLSRPHYHAILFNLELDDLEYLFMNPETKDRMYTSKYLEEKWEKGFVSIGSATLQSANYVSRYITKKIKGNKAEKHYNGKLPEYLAMSRNPGIGSEFYEKYKQDLYGNDRAVVEKRGKMIEYKVPRYYDTKYELDNPEHYEKIREKRKRFAETDTINHIRNSQKDEYRREVTKKLPQQKELNNGKYHLQR